MTISVATPFDPAGLIRTLRGEGIDVEPQQSDCLITATDTLAAVIHKEPDFEDVPAGESVTHSETFVHDCDAVVIGTPIDLARIIDIKKPNTRVYYDLQEIGSPNLESILSAFVSEHSLA